MFFKKTAMAAALVGGCLAFAGPALAYEAEAWAYQQSLSYRLVDLDPEDDITPALEFSTGSWDEFATPSDGYGTASTILDGTMEAFAGADSNAFSAYVWHSEDFSLTPYTRVEFRTEAAAGGYGAETHSVAAHATLFGMLEGANAPAFSDQTDIHADGTVTLYGVVDNPSASYLQGSVTRSVDAMAAIAPVPEPEPYGMLLAGLGIVGAIARRRARAA